MIIHYWDKEARRRDEGLEFTSGPEFGKKEMQYILIFSLETIFFPWECVGSYKKGIIKDKIK